jgi:hypothetical protein
MFDGRVGELLLREISSPQFAGGVVRCHSLDFNKTEAVCHMIVHHSNGLHEGVSDG